MKSKIDRMLEALNESKDKDDEWSGAAFDYYKSLKSDIEKDLEVLEILKNYINKTDENTWYIDISNIFVDEEEEKIIKEWLKNE